MEFEMIDKSIQYAKIFVGNVPFQCSKEEFTDCFNKYKGFLDADIVNRFNSENCRGFGFVTFKICPDVLFSLNNEQICISV